MCGIPTFYSVFPKSIEKLHKVLVRHGKCDSVRGKSAVIRPEGVYEYVEREKTVVE